MTRSYEAWNERGILLRTFSHRDLAENFRTKNEALLGPLTIKTVRLERRKVAA